MLFGAHVSSAGGAHKACERAAELGCDALQLFTQSPRTWAGREPGERDGEKFRAARAEHGIGYAMAHAPYLINLGTEKPEFLEKSREALSRGMRAADVLGLDSVVVHVGSHRGQGFENVLGQVAEAIGAALAASETAWLLLENSAGHGDTIGRTAGELGAVVDACGRPERLGVCIDSCHWWVSGVDVSDHEVLTAALDDLDANVGLDRLKALHVNDAKTEFGSNLDRHANLSAGTMGEGLSVFLQHEALRDLPALLEVPGDGKGPTAGQVSELRRLAGA